MEGVLASEDPPRQERVEGVDDVAKNAAASTSRERAHLTGKLIARFKPFQRGEWHILLEASGVCNFRAQRALRAEGLIQMGELLHARQVLEGAALVPGNQATSGALQDPERRPAQPREPLRRILLSSFWPDLFSMDEKLFNRNLRSSRRSAAAGPSGMTMEHLSPLLEKPGALHSFFLIGEKLAQALVPGSVVDTFRIARGECSRGAFRNIVLWSTF